MTILSSSLYWWYCISAVEIILNSKILSLTSEVFWGESSYSLNLIFSLLCFVSLSLHLIYDTLYFFLQSIINLLSSSHYSPEDDSFEVSLKTAAMSFLNALINCGPGEVRLMVWFGKLGFLFSWKIIRKNTQAKMSFIDGQNTFNILTTLRS